MSGKNGPRLSVGRANLLAWHQGRVTWLVTPAAVTAARLPTWNVAFFQLFAFRSVPLFTQKSSTFFIVAMMAAFVGALGAAAVVAASAHRVTPAVPASPAAPARPPMSTLRRICSSKDFRTTETLVNQSVRIESTNGSGHVNG